MRRVIYIIIILIVCIGIYGIYFEPNYITSHEYNIKVEQIPDSFKELTFIHFSDLLYNSTTDKNFLENLTMEINNRNPNVIFFTGDLFYKDNPPDDNDIADITNSLKKMDATLYKFAIIGENDNKYLDTYKKILEDSNFILLDNSSKLLFYKDINPINIIGANDMSTIDSLLNENEHPAYQIVLTHNPDNFNELKNKNINLVLAGHSLCGQVRIPYYGGALKRNGANTYIDNYYNEFDKSMYVSNGLGTIKYNIRLFNKPSFNVYRFNK